ncbi:MAG: DUF4846 domain-containing protein [bacterium]|nr:DUF4846 domain-containing protein [bacterium]
MRFLLSVFLFLFTANSLSAGIVEEYKKQYDFISMEDTIFTFESEFVLPKGYDYSFNNDLNSFQVWLRDFPLWHQWKWVGRYKGGKEFESEEIARPVHLPWDGLRYSSRGFMVRIIAEYYRFAKQEDDFAFSITDSEPITLDTWLSSQPRFSSQGKLIMKPDMKREKSDREFYSLVHFVIDKGSYISLAANLDTISMDDLSIGDLLICHDRTGKNGQAYIIMNSAENSGGEKRFILATGCPSACDFYIPKFDKDKNSPWLSLKEIHALSTEFEHRGYYRFRDIPNR